MLSVYVFDMYTSGASTLAVTRRVSEDTSLGELRCSKDPFRKLQVEGHSKSGWGLLKVAGCQSLYQTVGTLVPIPWPTFVIFILIF